MLKKAENIEFRKSVFMEIVFFQKEKITNKKEKSTANKK